MPSRSRSRSRSVLVVAGSLLALGIVIASARLLGSRSVTRSTEELEAKKRAAGIVNRLTIVNMLESRVMITTTDVDLAQWGLTPPNDEPPAGLEALVIDPQRVSPETGLRPLRIEDGGGNATFTISVVLDSDGVYRPPIGVVPTRSTSIEYCAPTTGKCFDGYAYFDWQDAPEPALDVFRTCVVDDRVIGSYLTASGERRDVHALFQCDATKFQSTLVLHD